MDKSKEVKRQTIYDMLRCEAGLSHPVCIVVLNEVIKKIPIEICEGISDTKAEMTDYGIKISKNK